MPIKAAITPKTMAAVIPAAAEVSPPVSIPIAPWELTASFTPCAIRWPKPESGTEAPAPANFAKGSYSPMAERVTPKTTQPVRILAGVSFVKSMRI